MIQINLIPDVKRDLLRAQAVRNWVIFLSTIIGAGSIALVVVTGMIFGGLALTVSINEDNIKKNFETLSKTPDINETIIVQSQLNEIQKIRNAAPNTSRILGQIVGAITTTDSNEVSISSVSYDPATKTLSVDGQTPKGYSALEGFKKTIKETKILYREEAKGESCTIDKAENGDDGCIIADITEDGQVQTNESSLGDNEEGQKVLRFKVSFILNSASLQFSTKDFAIKSPNKKDVTDSKTIIRDDIFKADSIEEEK